MSQNIVIPGRDNKVRLTFEGLDLTQANNLIIGFGGETYSLIDDPTVVEVTSPTELSINLNTTAEKGRVFVRVTYVDALKQVDITGQVLGNLEQVIVAIGSQLIVEDGSIVENANSLASLEELNLYASLRGYALPATEPERDTLMIKAMDYLFSIESKLQGVRAKSTQELPFPRVGVHGRNAYIASNVIITDWKRSQMELAIQVYEGELLQTGSSKEVQTQKVGDIETTYFEQGVRIKTEKAEAYLKPYYKNGGTLQMVRV